MPVQVYSADFRMKDGEIMRSSDLKDNFQDIQDTANSLDWMNIEDGSLDQFHVKIGEPLKVVGGNFVKKRAVAGGFQNWYPLVSVNPQVQVGSAVYAFASVTFDRLNAVGTVRDTILPDVGDRQPADLKTSIRISAPYTMRTHHNAYCPAVYGQAGIVHAYRVTSQMLANPAGAGAPHQIDFSMRCSGGPHPFAQALNEASMFFPVSYQSYWDDQEKMGVMANFIVFVVDR